MARPVAGQELRRDQILDVALRIVEVEGLPKLTLRSVADELGVTPTAIYHHVDSKQDLVDLLVARVTSSLPVLLGDPDARWEDTLRTFLRDSWKTMIRYPDLGALHLRRPGLDDGGNRAMLQFFEESGFTPKQARLSLAFVQNYLYGRLNVQAHLRHESTDGATRPPRAIDGYTAFGIDAAIAGLRAMVESES